MIGKIIPIIRLHFFAAAGKEVAWRQLRVLSGSAGKTGAEVLSPPTTSNEELSQPAQNKKSEFYSTTPLIMDASSTAPLK